MEGWKVEGWGLKLGGCVWEWEDEGWGVWECGCGGM